MRPAFLVREELPEDRSAIRGVQLAAFPGREEAGLVDRLRADWDVALSVVATQSGAVVGHALFSRMTAPFRALALAPVSVLPALQKQGAGRVMIEYGLRIAATNRS